MKHVENSFVNQSKRLGFFFFSTFSLEGQTPGFCVTSFVFISHIHLVKSPQKVFFFFLHRGKTEQSDLLISVYAFNEQPGKVVLLISSQLKRKQISFGSNAGL